MCVYICVCVFLSFLVLRVGVGFDCISSLVPDHCPSVYFVDMKYQTPDNKTERINSKE